MAVLSDFGAWLKSPALYSTAISATAAQWGDIAKDSTVISPLALKADADNEAAEQRDFLSGPLARDRHMVKGYRADLIGQVVIITAGRMGYEAGATVFVIKAAEQDGKGQTELTVLKRL